MAIIVATDNVSEVQLNYLEEARIVPSPLTFFRILERLISDDDITSGSETLHPEWIDLFELHKDDLDSSRRYLGRHRSENIFSTFRQLGSPIDLILKDINPLNENVAFLLGAGASKPAPSNIPTVKELLPELLRRARRLDRDQVTNLADLCDELGVDDIEDLLTAVQISHFCSRNPRILRLVQSQLFNDGSRFRNEAHNAPRRRALPSLRNTDVSSVAYLQDNLQILFGLLSNLMLPASPNDGHQAIVDFLRKRPSTPIVTTNYDCCIDLALFNNRIPLSYTIDFANPAVMENQTASPSSDSSSTDGQVAAPLIKLHGSLNWFYCETCQEVRLINIKQTVDDYTSHRAEYPIISVCNECGGPRRGLLVPPHAMKFDVAPPLQPLVANAATCFESASLIVVVGFSFADADLYISRMLTKSLQASPNTKIAIVDPDRNVIEKVRRRFSTQIPDFDSESRILKLLGDCSEVLPRFLSGSLMASLEKSASPQSTSAVVESS